MKTPVYLFRKRTLSLIPPGVSELAFLLSLTMLELYEKTKDMPEYSGIYALVCPDRKDIRYVGKSKNIKRRYRNHMWASPHSTHPVKRWVSKLKSEGKAPLIAILFLGPEADLDEKEIYFIKKYREMGNNLLNLHDGGAIPSAVGNGRNAECWSVKGESDAYKILRNRLFPMVRRSESIKKASRELSKTYRKLKTEKERTEFHLSCFLKIQDLGFVQDEKKAERWLEKAAAQINEKFPGRVTLKYSCGTIYVP